MIDIIQWVYQEKCTLMPWWTTSARPPGNRSFYPSQHHWSWDPAEGLFTKSCTTSTSFYWCIVCKFVLHTYSLKFQVSKYTRSPATDGLLTKRKIMWARCSTPLVSSGVPSWGIRPRGTNPEVLERRKKKRRREWARCSTPLASRDSPPGGMRPRGTSPTKCSKRRNFKVIF